MKVARQFIAWNRLEEKESSRRDGVILSVAVGCFTSRDVFGPTKSYRPAETSRFFTQPKAVNCLETQHHGIRPVGYGMIDCRGVWSS